MGKLIDETGNRYGKWTVLKRVENSRNHQARWLCKCDCGTERAITGGLLRSRRSQSCGCAGRATEEIIGQKYGRLTIIERAGSDSLGSATWLCECSCGNRIVVRGASLRSGHTKSCGCLYVSSLPEGEASFNHILAGMRCSARRRGYKWQLAKEQLRALTKQPCYYCGAEPNQGSSHSSPNGGYLYNGIDRIHNDLDYTIDNVVPSCGVCNKAKNVMTIEQFRLWIRRVNEYFAK